MRLIDGTPQEIAEFLRLTGTDEDSDSGAPAEVATDAPVDALEWTQISALVNGRARSADVAKRVLDFLRGVVDLGNVEIGPGASERTQDGLTDYVMVRDAGIRRYGAVAYVKPRNGGLTLRLTKEDVTDLNEPHVSYRDVRPGHQYVVNCPLRDDDSVETALKLVQLALAKVRK
ncbi:hypothetical protein [Streptomyces sp. MH60]|uniref:hypothetical protein n=1 Tax=Streptomyces sp. MH60 TaxID=1940758 RepID=UPI000D4BE444|nr:hypothetical protein [Streptomyces sp. MH60]PPS89357.1 hypothetical protein BZZ08_01852 [Streptomyces sp. MH60]